MASNYGWPCREGLHDYLLRSGLRRRRQPRDPVLEKPHGTGGFCAIVGGHVVRDPGLPSLLGRYVYGDNCNQASALGGPGGAGLGTRPWASTSPAWPASARTPAGASSSSRSAGRCRGSWTARRRRATGRRRPRKNAHHHRGRKDRGDAVRRRAARASRRRPAQRGPAALHDHDARHRPALAPAPRLPLARAAHRRGLPSDDQRPRLPHRHDPPQARHPQGRQAAPDDEPGALDRAHD